MKTLWIAAIATVALGGFAVASVLPEAPVLASASGQAAAPKRLVAGPSAPSSAIALAPSGPVVAELFTSQGCSSCPPADAVAARLARDPAILVISRPVTYWDRLGWKDSLGREGNTRLQRQYGDTAFGGANIYTPQLVVDGRSQNIGSQEAGVRSLLAHAASHRQRTGVRVQVTGSAGQARTVRLDGPAGQKAEVMLVALSSRETVKIGRGENGGRTISYTNVVLDEARIGTWAGGSQALTVTAAQLDRPGADRHALIVRNGPGGAIIGSAVI